MIVMQEATALARKQAAKEPSTPNPGWHERCSGAKRTSRQQIQKGDFGHAVDNPGNFAGALAGWFTFARRWQPDPPAPGRSRGCIDYQSRDWPPSSLAVTRARGRCWPGLGRLGHRRDTSIRGTDNPTSSQ